MQIVIDIDDELYANVTSDIWCGNYAVQQVIKNGTPLPKGHGRLIDADKAIALECGLSCGCNVEECGYSVPCKYVSLIQETPTVIESDKEEE